MHQGVFERRSGHEQVVFCQDSESGLRAIIAIYSTALGPALGGTRFHPYPSEEAALADVLELAKGMAYKNAVAGLPHGGGKAVIIGDPRVDKSDALLRSYGRFVESLHGTYITACDVGTTVRDMDVAAQESHYVLGRSRADGGAGDSSVLTAFGVYRAMLACAEYRWGTPSVKGLRIAVSGVGKVGSLLAKLLVEQGARVVVHDVDDEAVRRLRLARPEIRAAVDGPALMRTKADIFAPCALGGVLDEQAVGLLGSEIVCGAANNQLAEPAIAKELHDRGVLYAPDYVVNAGGVIQVADELHGFTFQRAKRRAAKIFEATRYVLELADEEGLPPATAADRVAERRMAEARQRTARARERVEAPTGTG
ncbi:valine dehydrogenase [Amycolatopsis thermalba]|uniref:Valine dehydrogenase n=1 Tax=Amycolatopsis thermalba TaxID=944492 RepID=A0ABY4P5I4_9PSEU|nr:Glu/Leu/Phe/Val dehydrogenase [Amycolatopsis thermalba]UQS27554.1 valine dehydrogenase [Amycolatopsis thermalba]